MEERNSVQDLYKFTQQFRDQNESGFLVPKTCLYLSPDQSFSKAKRDCSLINKSKKYLGLDPAKYSEDIETSEKRYWYKPCGAFVKSKKEPLLSQTLKHTSSMPGPGTYFENVPNVPITGPLGKFCKEERLTFVSAVQACSELSPSSWKYTPYPAKSKKNYQNGMYHSLYYKPNPEKEDSNARVGPGSYNPDKSMISQVLNKTQIYTIPKQKKIDTISMKILQNKFVPGVGSYPGMSKSFTIEHNMDKKKPIINPYKFLRFSESTSKLKAWVPGPGSYNIGPLPKIYKDKGDHSIKEEVKKPEKSNKKKLKS